jgi:hypothetical protein
MSPRYHAFRHFSLDGGASYEANEPLVVATGDAEEEEDHRLEERVFSHFLGLLAGFITQISIMGAKVLLITLSGEDLATKSKTKFVVFDLLLWSFFIAIFLRNLVTNTYWTVGGRSIDLLEATVLLICSTWAFV